MADLTGFGYMPGTSVLHRIDVRVKMLCLVLVGWAALNAIAGVTDRIDGAFRMRRGVYSLAPFDHFL